MKKRRLLSILLLSIVLIVAVSGYVQSPTEVKKLTSRTLTRLNSR
ncbi:MAG TPA: hypothetical protein P5198_01600 [Flexilinea sp.]|nr:hypothetical protein [Flexilinea sp.]